MEIKSIFQKSIFREGIIFFIAGFITNFLNYVYRILMGRLMGPEIFGELAALISLFLILAVPSAPLQMVSAKFSAVFEAEERNRKLSNLFGYLTKSIGLMSLGIVFFSVIFADRIKDFLNLPSKTYIYILAAIVVATLISGVTKGILQGLSKFSQLSYAIILESAIKVILSVAFVAIGFKMFGALAGFLIPVILVYFLTLYFLRDTVQISNLKSQISNLNVQKELILMKHEEKKEIWKYIFFTFLTFLFINLLLNADKILVKHYFPAVDAGVFAALSTLGQSIFIGVSALAGILFPIVASRQAKRENYLYPLKIISLISFIVGTVGIIILFLFSKEFILLFFGNEYLGGIPFLGYYGIAMGLFGFLFFFSYFFMALNKFKFLYVLAAGSELEIILISAQHNNFFQVISMLVASLALTLIGMIILIFREKTTA